MKAAIVQGQGRTPEYGEFVEPVAQPGERLVSVTAAALSQLTRSRASGQHYSSKGEYPFVAGVDGVGLAEDGSRVYFVLPRTPFGAMAERTVVAVEQCIALPDALDDLTAAAMANPGMSSWAAFVYRARLKAGETVLVNGATGTSGRLAVQIARHLGAKKVIATGRNEEALQAVAALGADVTILLSEDERALDQAFQEQFAAGVDVVLDYLWGPSARTLLMAGARAGAEAVPIRFVQVGSMSGGEIALPSAVLRSSAIELMGSGIGSVPLEGLVEAIRGVMQAAVPGQFRIATTSVPLSDVESAWTEQDSRARTVFTVGSLSRPFEQLHHTATALTPRTLSLRGRRGGKLLSDARFARSDWRGLCWTALSQERFFMAEALKLPRFSVGVGDRFAHQAKAQLAACIKAGEAGVEVAPVWNKSNREHTIIGTEPSQTRAAADAAVKELGWKLPYFLDADHINLKTVDRFIEPCDFFTLDVADEIGKAAAPADVDAFVSRHPELIGEVRIPRIAVPFKTDVAFVKGVANKFLAAVQDAGKIYRYVLEKKGAGKFVPEVSMDETDAPQTPVELLIILAAIADEKIPIQTVAPKFTGRFNKGVDYVGDVAQFTKEFEEDLAAIDFAVKRYGLPENLKLSVHSGSDKFSIYKAIHDAVVKFDAGVHLKTAGTTWLEELIGLAEAGGSGLEIAKEVYAEAFAHAEELCKPYATVIDIDYAKLPSVEEVKGWSSEKYTDALRHDQSNSAYNPSFRQLLHVGFKVAAKMGDKYLKALEENEDVVAKNVTTNLFDRHIKPVFLGQ